MANMGNNLQGGGDRDVGIIVELILNAQNLIDSVKEGINRASQIAEVESRKISAAITKALGNINFKNLNVNPLSQSFDAAKQKLVNLRAELEGAINSGKSWSQSIADLPIKFDEVVMAMKQIKRIVDETGVSLQKATQIGIAQGKFGIGTGQAALGAISGEAGKVQSLNILQAQAAVEAYSMSLAENTGATITNAQAQNNLSAATKQVSGAVTQTSQTVSKGKSFLQGMFDGVTNLIGRLLLLQYTFGFITQAVNELSQKYLDMTKAQYQLETSVKVAQNALGTQAISLSKWKDILVDLSKVFPQFSKKDLLEGAASINKLQANLKLNNAQMEEALKVSAALAQMSGVSLVEATDDYVKALGGSAVVLDKYGIFLRDADKNVTNFAKSIGKSTDQMTSQELALSTVEAISAKVLPIMEQMGDYQETMAGKIQKANAEIENSNTAIGESLAPLSLAFTQLWSDVLKGIQEILQSQAFKDFNAWLKELDKRRSETEKINSEVGAFKFGDLLNPSTFAAGASGPVNVANLVKENFAKGAVGAKTLDEILYDQFDYSKTAERIREIDKLLKDGAIGERANALKSELRDLIAQKNQQLIIDQADLLFNAQYIGQDWRNDPNLKAQYDAFIKNYNDYLDARNEAANALKRNSKGVHAFKSGVTDTGEGTVTGISEEEKNALKKAYQDIIDTTIDYNRDLDRLAQERMDKLVEVNKDEIREIEKNVRERRDAELKAQEKNNRDLEDEQTRYLRSIRDLEEDERSKIEDVEKDTTDRTKEIWEDYYKALRELDRQYYFDIRDAVAENDAVAVKRLERKYNLDKAKLDDNLEDKLNDEIKAKEKSIKNIQDETAKRRKELEQRHKDELEDLAKKLEREIADIKTAAEIENRELKIKMAERREDIEQDYTLQRRDLNSHYEQRLEDIGRHLREEIDIHGEYLNDFYQQLQTYFGDDGLALKVLNGYYDQLHDLMNNLYTDTLIYDPDFQKWLETLGILIPDKYKNSGGSNGTTPAPPATLFDLKNSDLGPSGLLPTGVQGTAFAGQQDKLTIEMVAKDIDPAAMNKIVQEVDTQLASSLYNIVVRYVEKV